MAGESRGERVPPLSWRTGESAGKNGVILSDLGERVWLLIRMWEGAYCNVVRRRRVSG